MNLLRVIMKSPERRGMSVSKDLSVFDRRMKIISVLMNNEQVSRPELAKMFSVSLSAIHRDINAISRYTPISSNRGRYGGIFIPDKLKRIKNYLSHDEEHLIRRLSNELTGEDKLLLQHILHKFSMSENV